ncbi:MAG TPA: hypothetical protein VNY78_03350 [Edaphobacter sp.]|nr:hypothetical protein [Edaphobacter sp.]
MPLPPALRRLHISTSILSLFILPAQIHAQAIPSGSSNYAAGSRTASASTNDAGPSGIVPFTQGFNVSLGTSSQHDSSDSWSSILTPGLAYRFNRLFSLSASVPVYAYVNVQANTGTKAKPVYVPETKHGVPGDTTFAAHLDAHPARLDYNATLSLGLPSGNTAYGLGAGQTTYDVNNQVEKSFGIFSPDIEFGIASSNNLIQTRVHKSYTSVGTLAHFQAGTSIDLPLNMSFEADAYEILPLNSSTIYSATGKGKKKVNTATTTGNAEDNGFIASLDIPVSGHVTLSGFYDRSIRNLNDVAGLSLTFLMRAPPSRKETIR